jgi:hypothetical protein
MISPAKKEHTILDPEPHRTGFIIAASNRLERDAMVFRIDASDDRIGVGKAESVD